MQKRIRASVIAALLFTIAVTVQSAAAARPAAVTSAAEGDLPIRRVVLYKNGVGYFEHSARVQGSEDLHIDFTTAQLNDVLKSLTVVDLNGGRIAGMRFNSVAPLDERLRALRLPLGEETSRLQFLEALRSARVVVRDGASTVAGRVLSVEVQRRLTEKGNEITPVLIVSVFTDNGELRSVVLGPGTTVRIADRELADKVGQYLNLIGSSLATDTRRMTISADGAGDRNVLVSYISEVPVWKTTYRIILPEKPGNDPLIQGWAIVDNTLGQDWNGVQLSLVAGAPQSFVENVSLPYYVRRPVVALPQSLMLTPQTHEAALMPSPAAKAMDFMQAKAAGIAGGIPGGVVGGVLGNPKVGFGAGGGIGSGVFSAIERQRPEAEGRGVGDLFEYNIKEKVTIGKNQSALVPILQTAVNAEKVTLWNDSNAVALRSLWLANTTGMTLDSGTFNVMDDETFAGEGLLDSIRPGERRLISYAADPAVQVVTNEDSSVEAVSRVRIADGLMTMTCEQRATRTYRISNADSKPREVIIEHPIQEGWKLSGGLRPEETSSSFYRFKVDVGPRSSGKLVVAEVNPEITRVALTNLTGDEVTLLARQRRLTPALEAALRQILDQKGAIAALDAQLKARQHEVASISADQGRIRENMKALKGGAEEKALLSRYVRELNAQEDRLSALRAQIAGLKAKREAAAGRLNQTLAATTLDQTF
jgi:hypothetical protein